MLHDIIFFLIGLALIIAGGNYLTDGAVAVARRLRVSNLIIGLTVVAFGSSMPDLVVCLTSTFTGKTQLALGDVVGANIFDVLLVVGVVAMVRPLSVSHDMLTKDLPMLALSSMALFFCGDDRLFDGEPFDLIDRTDGLMLLAFFVIFICLTLSGVRNGRTGNLSGTEASPRQDTPPARGMNMWLAALCIAGGLTALIIGGNWIVDGASGIALKLGLSESIVGLTVVALGSAAPDLATSVIAAVKGQAGIAIGNVVGACVFNVFCILGLCATVSPLHSGTISVVDFSVLAGASLLVWLFAATPRRTPVISRPEGTALVVAYAAYMSYIVITALHSIGR